MELTGARWDTGLHKYKISRTFPLSSVEANTDVIHNQRRKTLKGLLKETARQIAPSLTQLFNLSLCCGTFPDDWKLANIIPVYKKGKKQYVDNYRPISLLSIVSKVLERCVLGKIRDHIFCLISCIQHGFTSGKSCTT